MQAARQARRFAVHSYSVVGKHDIVLAQAVRQSKSRRANNQSMKSVDILDDQENKLRAAERDTLRMLTTAIGPLEPDAADVELLHQAAADLDELFCW